MILTRRGALIGSAALASVALTRASAAESVHIAVTKGTGCECCEGWAKHLRASGYNVSVTETEDLEAVKTKLAIPEDLRTCHTGQMGDYLLEGHVPAVAVAYLLREKPEGMIGLAVPGMPVGSPGMEVKGAKLDDIQSSCSARRAAACGANSGEHRRSLEPERGRPWLARMIVLAPGFAGRKTRPVCSSQGWRGL